MVYGAIRQKQRRLAKTSFIIRDSGPLMTMSDVPEKEEKICGLYGWFLGNQIDIEPLRLNST